MEKRDFQINIFVTSFLFIFFFGEEFNSFSQLKNNSDTKICASDTVLPCEYVQNGNFENFSICPTMTTQIGRACNWDNGNWGTTDYYNSNYCGPEPTQFYCDTGSYYSLSADVPFNSWGYQNAHSDSGYCGLAVWYGYNYREYAKGNLVFPLTIGQKYIVSMWASLANCSMFASDNIGVLFTTYNIFYNSDTVISWANPQIQTPANSFITDTVNWTFIQDTIIADSNYKYITIGNFNLNSNTNLLNVGGKYSIAYYYFDDVSVKPVLSIDAGLDKEICYGDSILLSATGTPSLISSSYNWSPANFLSCTNCITTVSNPDSSTTYTFTASDTTNCIITDTIMINVNPLPTVKILGDTLINLGESTTLTVSSGNNYLWNTQEITASISVSPTSLTTYSVTVTDSNGCRNADEVNIKVELSNYISVPSIFSPNNDGINDKLFLHGYGIKEFEFTIYDRWGEKIFESKEKSIGWDGTFNGQYLNSAIFVYTVTGKFSDDSYINVKGNITLLR